MRKKVEAGAVDVVSRIRTVKAQDYQPKSSAHRAAVGGPFEGARAAREAARLKRLAATPPDPARLKPLTVALFVTRHRASIRQWSKVETLLQQINLLFEPAKIEFQLTEPAEFTRSVSFASRCPFEADLDHEFEWLHLAMVPKLPEDQPVLPACGRCALISDRCSDQAVAEALARLLGSLEKLDFNWPQIQWLRWQTWLLQGQPVPLPLVRMPLWCYLVITPEAQHSQRNRAEVEQLLERANQIWLQAGLAFEMVNFCPLSEAHCPAERWQQALLPEPSALSELTGEGPRALHLFFLKERGANWICLPDQANHLVLVRDEMWREELPERRLAHALGTMLGLLSVSGEDQLMCPYTQGTRLSAAEATRARQRALSWSHGQPDLSMGELRKAQIEVAPPPNLPPLDLKVNLFLLRDSALTTRPEAADWVERVNLILAQAGITVDAEIHEPTLSQAALEAALPNPPGAPSQRKATCAGLQKLPGYDPSRLNLFVAHQLPLHGRPDQFGSYTSWPAARVVLLAEKVDWHSPEKQLALALAVGSGQKASPTGPFGELLTSRTPGLRLTAEQALALRAALTGGEVSAHSQLTIPVTIYENGAEAGRKLEQANFFWSQAGLRWQVAERRSLPQGEYPESLLAQARPATVQLAFDPAARPQVHREHQALVAHGDLAPALAEFLHLKPGGPRLTATEVNWARAQALHLKEVLEPGTPAGPLPALQLPLRLHLIRNARHGYQGEQDWPALVAQAAEILQPAAISLSLRGCQEVVLADAAVEAALPGELKPGSFSGLTAAPGYDPAALNLYVGGGGLFALDKPARALLIHFQRAGDWTPARLLARSLAAFLDVPPNDFSGPDSLRGAGAGTRLTPLEIERMREAVQRSFPALKFSFTPAGPAVLPIKLRLAANLDPQALMASLRVIGLELRWVGCDRLEIPAAALQEACPGPGKLPMHFKLMTLPGYDPRALNLLVVEQLPVGRWAAFPLARTALATAESLQAALDDLLGQDPPATARRLFPLG